MSIAIDHTQMGASDQTNFTDILYFTDADFADAAHGGKIQNSTTVSVNGTNVTMPTDFVISTAITSTPLSSLTKWVFLKWDNTTGECQIAILYTSASHTSNSTYYAYYDAPSVTAWQGGTTGSAFNTHCRLYMALSSLTTLIDFSSHGNNSTSHPGTTATTVQVDGAVAVDQSGAANGVVVGDNLYHMCGSVVTSTVICWFSSSSISADPVLWDLQTSGSLGAFIEVGGTTTFWWGYNGTFRTCSSISPSMSNNTSYHLATVHGASGNNGSLYFNGVLQPTFSGSFGDPSNTGTSLIGNYHAGTNSNTTKIDEFSIWDQDMGADFILANYNDTKTPGTPSVAGFNIFGTKTHT